MSDRTNNAAITVSLVGILVSCTSAYFAYRSATAAERIASLQAAQAETRLRLVAMLNPSAKRGPELIIKLANEGAPTVVENLGFELFPGKEAEHYLCWRPDDLDALLPLRLDGNASLDLTLGPKDLDGLKRDQVLGLIAATATGRVVRLDNDALRTYLKEAR